MVLRTKNFAAVISKRQYIYHFKTIEVAVAHFERIVIYHLEMINRIFQPVLAD